MVRVLLMEHGNRGIPKSGKNLPGQGGFVPVKPFIFSDGEVLGEQAQACCYCTIPWC